MLSEVRPSSFVSLLVCGQAMADHSVALLALLVYTFLVCYLLVCVVKGCFKFGSNVSAERQRATQRSVVERT